MDDYLRSLLAQYTVYASTDIVKSDCELVHDTCEQIVCDVEPNDTLAVLVATVLDHDRSCDGTGTR